VGPVSERREVPPEKAAAIRRAAALYSHWRRKGTGADGEMAVFDEIGWDDNWAPVVCALLGLTDGLVAAARDGREDEYLAYVLRESMLDEVSGA
jgi:hypothetical protein